MSTIKKGSRSSGIARTSGKTAGKVGNARLESRGGQLRINGKPADFKTRNTLGVSHDALRSRGAALGQLADALAQGTGHARRGGGGGGGGGGLE